MYYSPVFTLRYLASVQNFVFVNDTVQVIKYLILLIYPEAFTAHNLAANTWHFENLTQIVTARGRCGMAEASQYVLRIGASFLGHEDRRLSSWQGTLIDNESLSKAADEGQ